MKRKRTGEHILIEGHLRDLGFPPTYDSDHTLTVCTLENGRVAEIDLPQIETALWIEWCGIRIAPVVDAYGLSLRVEGGGAVYVTGAGGRLISVHPRSDNGIVVTTRAELPR